MKNLSSLKHRLSQLQASVFGQYETVGEQYKGYEIDGKDGEETAVEGVVYEAAGLQHPNSKGQSTNLVMPQDRCDVTEGSPFEVPEVLQQECSVEMKMLDGQGSLTETPMVDVFGSTPQKMVSDKNVVFPSVAKKMARNAAVLGVMLVAPLFGLFGQMQDRPDFLEVACSANSSLSEEMSQAGFHAKRINFLEGYDLSSSRGTRMLKHEISMHTPRFAWISLPCTRLTSLVNLTPRTDEELARFQKRQRQDLKRASEVADACEPILAEDGDLAWEWPAHATAGWKSYAINKLLGLIKKHRKVAYWCF